MHPLNVRITLGIALGVAALAAIVVPRGWAVTVAQQQCEAAKNSAAGKYAACRQSAAANLAKTGDTAKYAATIAKCQQKFTGAWAKAGEKATASGDTCLDAPLGASAFDGVITDHTDNIKTALEGGSLANCPRALASCAGNLAICGAAQQGERLQTESATCYDGTYEISCAGTGQDGDLQQGLARRYTDNGDGTITDNDTGLMWEKHSSDGSIHDFRNIYTWLNALNFYVPYLNSTSFAGHTDWRLPNVNELHTLVDYGRVYPAMDPVFDVDCIDGCTVTTCSCATYHGRSEFWSSTTSHYTLINSVGFAWMVDFDYGYLHGEGKGLQLTVRAVRGG
jgi:hypothetical protein